jgi:hypothetical protein
MDLKLVPPTILETLERENGLSYGELYEKVIRLHDELDPNTFKDLIMNLEIKGLIKVYEMTKGNRRVELA